MKSIYLKAKGIGTTITPAQILEEMNKANPDSFTQLFFDRRREMAYFYRAEVYFVFAGHINASRSKLDDYKQAYEDYKSSGLSRAKGNMATIIRHGYHGVSANLEQAAALLKEACEEQISPDFDWQYEYNNNKHSHGSQLAKMYFDLGEIKEQEGKLKYALWCYSQSDAISRSFERINAQARLYYKLGQKEFALELAAKASVPSFYIQIKLEEYEKETTAPAEKESIKEDVTEKLTEWYRKLAHSQLKPCCKANIVPFLFRTASILYYSKEWINLELLSLIELEYSQALMFIDPLERFYTRAFLFVC